MCIKRSVTVRNDLRVPLSRLPLRHKKEVPANFQLEIGIHILALKLRDLDSIFGRVKIFSLHHRIQTCFWVHLAPCRVDTGGKATERETDHSPPSEKRYYMTGTVLHSPIRLHGVVLD